MGQKVEVEEQGGAGGSGGGDVGDVGEVGGAGGGGGGAAAAVGGAAAEKFVDDLRLDDSDYMEGCSGSEWVVE